MFDSQNLLTQSITPLSGNVMSSGFPWHQTHMKCTVVPEKRKKIHTHEISLNVHVSDIICLMTIVVLKELFHGPGSNTSQDEVPRLSHLVSLYHH